MTNLFIGLAGRATSGKDVFYNLAKDIVKSKFGRNLVRFALADELKEEIRELLIKKYSIDISNCTSDEKERVRSDIVSYAKLKRDETLGRCWIDKLNKKIKKYESSKDYKQDDVLCITDIRYFEYKKDEVYWLKVERNGVFIYIDKFYKEINENREFVNNEEFKNDPILRSSADYTVCWKHGDAKDNLLSQVNKSLTYLENVLT